jgi:hypothetical protein
LRGCRLPTTGPLEDIDGRKCADSDYGQDVVKNRWAQIPARHSEHRRSEHRFGRSCIHLQTGIASRDLRPNEGTRSALVGWSFDVTAYSVGLGLQNRTDLSIGGNAL